MGIHLCFRRVNLKNEPTRRGNAISRDWAADRTRCSTMPTGEYLKSFLFLAKNMF